MMTTKLSKFFIAALFGTALSAPVILMPATLRAEDRVYHDKARNDEHHWDSHEDRAYRIWVKENHRKHRGFAKLNEEEQEQYWAWRHDHSDALLHIDIK